MELPLNEVGVGTVLLELSRHVKKRANKPLPEIGKSPIMPGSKCIRESHKRERGSDYKNLSGCKVCDDAYVELFNDFTPEEAVKHLVDRLWNGGISSTASATEAQKRLRGS